MSLDRTVVLVTVALAVVFLANPVLANGGVGAHSALSAPEPGARPVGPSSPGVTRVVLGRPLVAPATSGGASTRLLVTTGDALAVPNDGVETNLTAFPSATFPADSSFQTGAEEVIGSYEAVFGLFTNDKTAPTAFYSIFTNATDQPVRNLYWTGLPIVAGGAYDFRLEFTNGTTWTLTVNGVEFGNATAAAFDFGATRSTWLGGLSYSEVAIYSATTTVPTSFVATTALAVHRPGGDWYLPISGIANYTGPSSAAYGIEGELQLSGFAPGEVVSGTSLAAVRTSEVLWNSGPVPVSVAVTVSPTTAAGLGFVNAVVSVTTPSGTPLGTVPVYVGDTLGGSATPSTVYTEENGAASTILTLANESATVGDSVRAVVTILGFVGSASTGLTVGPSVQILVSVSAPSLRPAGPGGRAHVHHHRRNRGGSPLRRPRTAHQRDDGRFRQPRGPAARPDRHRPLPAPRGRERLRGVGADDGLRRRTGAAPHVLGQVRRDRGRADGRRGGDRAGADRRRRGAPASTRSPATVADDGPPPPPGGGRGARRPFRRRSSAGQPYAARIR
jgi:hypothetical protein